MYYVVKCECGSEQIVYSKVSSTVKCINCKNVIAEPSGGNSIIKGEVVKKVDGSVQ